MDCTRTSIKTVQYLCTCSSSTYGGSNGSKTKISIPASLAFLARVHNTIHVPYKIFLLAANRNDCEETMGNVCIEKHAAPGEGYDGEALPSPVMSFRRRGSKPGPLTLRRFRSKSDFSLFQILHVSLLRESFIDFLRQDFKEQHVYFWLDVNNFNGLDPTKVTFDDIEQDAEVICHKFLQPSSAMRIEIDKDTIYAILKALKDGHIVKGMFDLAAEKM